MDIWNTIAHQLHKLVALLSSNPSYYPWQVIPPGGKAFDQAGTIQTPAAGGGVAPSPGTETVVVSLTCPIGYDGIVKRIGNTFLGASFNPGLPSLVWRIRSGSSLLDPNCRFIDNYNAIVVEYGSTQFLRETDGIFLSSGQTLLYTVTNFDPALPAGAASQVSCAFSGYFWPQQRSTN
jgi:hypothetical protein